MKKNKGFTLIELLGVVVILAVVIGLVFPNVINMIKKSNSEIDANTKELIYNAADLTLRENPETFPNDEVTAYCLSMKDLIDYGYLIDNVKINKENIKNTKAVLATPDVIENKENYDLYSNGFGYQIVEKEECDEYVIVPGIKKCLTDKKCHICNKLSDLKTWGYITENVILDGVDITNTHSYDFGDSSLGIKSGYITNEECENSKIYIAYKKLPNFSKSKAKSLGITYTSTSDYYSIDSNNIFREQVRKSSLLKRNFSKDEFSDLIITNNVEYTLNDKILTINKSKLLYDTEITGSYKVCLNGTSDCTKVEKNTSYTLDNLPTHNALLINGEYKYNESNDSYTISDVNKDYIIYTKTIYIVNLNGIEVGKYEKGSNVTVDLSGVGEFNRVIVNSNPAIDNYNENTYLIENIQQDMNIVTKMMYTITFKNYLIPILNISSIKLEKGSSYEPTLAINPFYDVSVTSGTNYTYNNSNGILSIPNLNQNIVVTGYYKVDYVDNTFAGAMGWKQSGLNNELIEVNLIQSNIYFEKNLGSYIPDLLEVNVGNDTLSSSNYTYSNGSLKINKSKIINNMTITASDDDIWVEPPELYDGALTPIVYMQIKYSNSAMTNEVSRVPVLNTIPQEESGYYYRYKWVVADPDSKYYNYKKGIWANAVVLKPGVTKKVGDIVNVDGTCIRTGASGCIYDATAMFVWIPRFSYTIGCKYSDLSYCSGNYENDPDRSQTYSTPGSIDVKFISKSNKDTGSAKYYGDVSNYYTMPAFTLTESDSSTSELAGIWVAKFGMSHIDKQSGRLGSSYGIECNLNDTCNSYSPGLVVLPGTRFLFNTQLSSFYNLIKTNNSFQFNSALGDMHMLKNSEFAAAIYLAMSLYGKYGNANYSDKCVAAGSSRSGASPTVCLLCTAYSTNEFGYGSELFYYNEYFKGTSASTTGNIYGIYDTGLGIIEYVMGYVGTSLYSIPSKYIDLYKYKSYPRGHGLLEIKQFYSTNSEIFDDKSIIERSQFVHYIDDTSYTSRSAYINSRPSIFAKTGN